MTAALAAWMVGSDGSVTVVDWSLRTVAHVRGALGTHPTLAPRVTTLHREDVTVGLPQHGPWDCVVMNGSVPKIPWPLLAQLSDRGRLLLFLQEPLKAGQSCYLLRRHQEAVEEEALSRFTFTPIYGRYGWDRPEHLARDWARRGQDE